MKYKKETVGNEDHYTGGILPEGMVFRVSPVGTKLTEEQIDAWIKESTDEGKPETINS